MLNSLLLLNQSSLHPYMFKCERMQVYGITYSNRYDSYNGKLVIFYLGIIILVNIFCVSDHLEIS
jgi:hypothetical protein